MRRKGILPLALGVIFVAILVGAYIFINYAHLGSGSVNFCSDTPYAGNCICPADEERLSVNAFGRTKYVCEKLDKFIDPTAINFASVSVDYAEQLLAANFPDCDMKTCSAPAGAMPTQWVFSNTEWANYDKRVVTIECTDASGFRYAKVEFNIVDGGVDDMACGSHSVVAQDPTSSEPAPIAVSTPVNIMRSGYVRWDATISSRCLDSDNGIATAVVVAPSGHIGSWKFLDAGTLSSTLNMFGGTCAVKDATEDRATIYCNTNCPHAPFDGYRFSVMGYYDITYWNSLPKCNIGTTTYFPGDTTICSVKGVFTCGTDGQWQFTPNRGVLTNNPVCVPGWSYPCAVNSMGYDSWYQPGTYSATYGTCDLAGSGQWLK